METVSITSARDIKPHMQRAVKAALAIGATVELSKDGEQLRARFDGGDLYYFDPENVTLHALELLGAARMWGIVAPRETMESFDSGADIRSVVMLREPLIVRSVFSAGDVRIQIGASKWFQDFNPNTAIALRRAICYAFASYYDEAIAPYTEA